MKAKALTPIQFTKAVMRSFMAESGLERRLFEGNKFRVMSAVSGRVDFEVDITGNHTNRMDNLHGGLIATLVDLGGSLAIASTGRFRTGVSTDISVTYLAPGGRKGEVLKGTALCDKMGTRLAFTRVTFTNVKGELAAHGSHTKYIVATIGGEPPYCLPKKYAVAEESDVD
ncbi:hypothetical protein XA68_15108 [Ophiocordyceps unilateralis]|uniref:Thioesterase domain-containing protein n=1 Tax=Ophiocordyceps unilateralis TaxID=268505 RepID=A0A2A9P942_OPHUN|nr:hypothetical protein XA68_15108 [Ophiocordyceps unilateralis]